MYCTNRIHQRMVMLAVASAITAHAQAAGNPANTVEPHLKADKARIAAYWTAERRASAIPRDLVIDERGLGYIRLPGGALEPYGHEVAATAGPRESTGKPLDDSDLPVITDMDPAEGAVIGATHTFSAAVTDATSDIKSVTFYLQKQGGVVQSFNAKRDGDTWSYGLTGFTDGNWTWTIEARDRGAKGGNIQTASASFSVDTDDSTPPPDPGGGDGGDTGDPGVVTDAAWENANTVKSATGRIYFEMPGNAKRKGPWSAYVCSGSVVTDEDDYPATDNGRSLILTAAHCVYDDVNKAFARNVMFIPDQDQSGTRTDTDCTNDVHGCWFPAFGVVDSDWANNTFPANIPSDYAFYVVADTGAHSGTPTESQRLETVTGAFGISFNPATDGAGTHAFGYSYNKDPDFRYCAEGLSVETSYSDWWLASCELSGGASGGPWTQDDVDGTNPPSAMSVNSWGYSSSPGMAGPNLDASVSSAACLYSQAINRNMIEQAFDGDAGYIEDVSLGCDPETN